MSFACLSTFAQEPISEPDFIGEVIMVKPDNTTTLLEKSTVKITTKAGASLYLVGIGKIKTRIDIEERHAEVRASEEEDFKLIVRAVDNNTDPISIISIFKFDLKGQRRRAELSSLSTFGGNSENNLNTLPFVAKKYGESSYIITPEHNIPGEYGVIVRNPNALDQKTLIVASFGID